MRYHATAALLIAALGCAAAEDAQLYRHVSVHSSSLLIPRALNPGLTRAPSLLKARQSSCLSSEQLCADGCIPSSAECCGSDGSFCPSGYYCDGPGCCETGQTCSGFVSGCPDGTVECGIGECALEGECPDGSSGSGSGSGSGSDDGSDSGSDDSDSGSGSAPTTTGFGSFPTPTFTRSGPTQTSSSNSNNDDDSSNSNNDNENGNDNGNGNGNGNSNNNGPPRNSGASGLLAPVIGAFFAAFFATC